MPEIVQAKNSCGLVKELLEELGERGVSARLEQGVEELLMRIACHSVIRGPRRLTGDEARALLRELSKVDFAAYCPHGRPVVKRFSRKEVERFFKR